MNFNEILLDIVLLSLIVTFGAIAFAVLKDYLENRNVLELSPLAYFEHSGKLYNLSEYFVDKKGQLYSRNRSTWEIDPRKDKDILVCSNLSTTKSGEIINTLRTPSGTKVTINRKEIKFRSWNTVKLKVTPVGTRHLKVNQVVGA